MIEKWSSIFGNVLVFADSQNWFVDFVAQQFRLNQVEGTTVDLDQSIALLADGNGGGLLLLAESVDHFLGLRFGFQFGTVMERKDSTEIRFQLISWVWLQASINRDQDDLEQMGVRGCDLNIKSKKGSTADCVPKLLLWPADPSFGWHQRRREREKRWQMKAKVTEERMKTSWITSCQTTCTSG